MNPFAHPDRPVGSATPHQPAVPRPQRSRDSTARTARPAGGNMIRLPRRPARYVSLLALTTGVLLAPAAPASADDPVADLTCAITVTVAVHPPLTPETRHVVTISDRKSTRLNSSHVRISYAVFCLKKKK